MLDDKTDEPCSIARALSLLGDRWTMMILRQAFTGIRRFDQFQSTLHVSRKLLTARLARLVHAGILKKVPYKDAQRTRYEYQLTAAGRDIYPVLMALRTWGDAHLAEDGPYLLYRHTGCEGVARSHLSCSQCGDPLTARDVSPEPGPGLHAWAERHTAGPASSTV